MSHGLFYRCPYYVSGPGNIAVALLSTEGQRALRFDQKYLNLCSEDERRSYGFGTTWGWVINDRIFIFRWTIPLLSLNSFFSCLVKTVSILQYLLLITSSWLDGKSFWTPQCACGWSYVSDVRTLLQSAEEVLSAERYSMFWWHIELF